MISQDVDGTSHWTVIRLADDQKLFGGRLFQGSWSHTGKSYNGTVIQFTGDNPQYLFWQWVGGPAGGLLRIGTRMPRAFYKDRGEENFQILITLNEVRREANGYFQFAASGGKGSGLLTNSVKPHFKSGTIDVSVVRYGGQPPSL